MAGKGPAMGFTMMRPAWVNLLERKSSSRFQADCRLTLCLCGISYLVDNLIYEQAQATIVVPQKPLRRLSFEDISQALDDDINDL